MRTLAPIVLFVYNRPDHTRRTIEALYKNDLAEQSELYIYADGAKNSADKQTIDKIEAVRQYLHSISGFKNISITEQEHNKGLDQSEIDAITDIVNKYGKVIVLEDDIVTSRFFLSFMNDALDFYEKDNRIYTVGGHTADIPYLKHIRHSIYASYRCESWGWATWVDRWSQCDWNRKTYDIIEHPTWLKVFRFNRGGNDLYVNLVDMMKSDDTPWDARWQYCLFENNGLCVRPTKSLVQNIGCDGTGVHFNSTPSTPIGLKALDDTAYNIKMTKAPSSNFFLELSMRHFFDYDKTPICKRIKWAIKNALKKI